MVNLFCVGICGCLFGGFFVSCLFLIKQIKLFEKARAQDLKLFETAMGYLKAQSLQEKVQTDKIKEQTSLQLKALEDALASEQDRQKKVDAALDPQPVIVHEAATGREINMQEGWEIVE